MNQWTGAVPELANVIGRNRETEFLVKRLRLGQAVGGFEDYRAATLRAAILEGRIHELPAKPEAASGFVHEHPAELPDVIIPKHDCRAADEPIVALG